MAHIESQELVSKARTGYDITATPKPKPAQPKPVEPKTA